MQAGCVEAALKAAAFQPLAAGGRACPQRPQAGQQAAAQGRGQAEIAFRRQEVCQPELAAGQKGRPGQRAGHRQGDSAEHIGQTQGGQAVRRGIEPGGQGCP